MRVTTKGQVTIPQEIREKLGIFPGTEVEFVVRGEEIVERIRGKWSVNLDLTTDQIMALTLGWGEDDFDRYYSRLQTIQNVFPIRRTDCSVSGKSCYVIVFSQLKVLH